MVQRWIQSQTASAAQFTAGFAQYLPADGVKSSQFLPYGDEHLLLPADHSSGDASAKKRLGLSNFCCFFERYSCGWWCSWNSCHLEPAVNQFLAVANCRGGYSWLNQTLQERVGSLARYIVVSALRKCLLVGCNRRNDPKAIPILAAIDLVSPGGTAT